MSSAKKIDLPALSVIRTIGVGSTNPVKVSAVQAVASAVFPAAQVQAIAARSGVRPQPLSDAEMVQGAKTRAQAARLALDADLGVGLEGGVQTASWGCMLTGWVAVIDRRGRVGLGSGGRLLLPPPLAEAISAGQELGPAMDQLSGLEKTHQGLGTVGILTRGIVAREEAFRVAIAYALARFLHPIWYGDFDEA